MDTLRFSTIINATKEELFSYHEKDSALKRLIPPFESAKLIHKQPGLEKGTTAHLQMQIGPFKKSWVSRHIECTPPDGFVDEQVSGPFKFFRHVHRFVPKENGKTEMIDELEFELPGGFLGKCLFSKFVKRKLTRMFDYRHRVVQEDFKQYSSNDKSKKLRVLISGASGFVGSTMTMLLDLFGHEVKKLVRKKTDDPDEIFWDPEKNEIDASKLEGFDAVIHLSGENVGSSLRWTKSKKRNILKSRILSTSFLSKTLNTLKNPPTRYLVASAYGIYGLFKEGEIDESSSKGRGFLADVCCQWEDSANEFSGSCVNMRFGVILGSRSGMLKKLTTVFKLCLGAVMGSQTRYMSWVAIDDIAYMIYHLLFSKIEGPVNCTTGFLSNQEFAKTLANLLKRPLLATIPEGVIKLLFGEMGEALFLSSLKVVPKKITASGFKHSYPNLSEFLKHELGI